MKNKMIIGGIVLFIVVAVIVVLLILFLPASQSKSEETATNKEVTVTSSSEKDLEIGETEETEITSFFQEHKSELYKIKDFFYSNKYSVKQINNDGNIVIKDNSVKWIPEISDYIKKIFDDGEKYNITNMYYKKVNDDKGLCFVVEFYYPDDAISVGINYAEKDLTQISNMYSSLGDNWYLFIAGMT